MQGKYTIWDRMDTACCETAETMQIVYPAFAAFSLWLGGFALPLAAERRNITTQGGFERLAFMLCIQLLLATLALSVVFIFIMSFLTAPGKKDIEKMLQGREGADPLFSGHAFHIHGRSAREGWLFLTDEGIEFAPFADMSAVEPLMQLVKRHAGTGTADTGSGTCKRKTIAWDMVVNIKKKNRYFPSNRVVITVKGGWDITFSIRDKEAFLSCYENIPGMRGGRGQTSACSADRAACP